MISRNHVGRHPFPIRQWSDVCRGGRSARGIGRVCAHRLAQLGADVVIADVNLDSAREFDEELMAATVPDEIRALGRRSIGVHGDLTQRAAVRLRPWSAAPHRKYQTKTRP